MVLSRFLPKDGHSGGLTLRERELVRLACCKGGRVRPKDAAEQLGLNHRTVVQTLKALCERGLLTAEGGAEGKRVVRYKLLPRAVSYL
jgi:DNA-binding MarR family transcriptional regulator